MAALVARITSVNVVWKVSKVAQVEPVKKYGRPWYRLPKEERNRIVVKERFAQLARGETFYGKHLVYFIQEPSSGAIKIGVAQDPAIRLAKLQTAHPLDLKLLGTCPGGLPLERLLHLQFVEDCIRREWFKQSDRLLARIKELCHS